MRGLLNLVDIRYQLKNEANLIDDAPKMQQIDSLSDLLDGQPIKFRRFELEFPARAD